MSAIGMTVPMHPEAAPGDPQLVRWVLPPGAVPFAGPVRSAPGALGELAAAGVIRSMECESCAVLIRLRDGSRWDELLSRVRDALTSAIGESGWEPKDEWQLGSEALLTAAVHEVLAGPAGDYVRSHGGEVRISSVAGDAVEVTFAGTCGHCPATGITLHDRLETEVRRRYPALRSITAVGNARGGPRFFSIRRRREA